MLFPFVFPPSFDFTTMERKKKREHAPFSNSKKYFEYISQTVIKMMDWFLRPNHKHAPFWYYYEPHISIGSARKLSVYSGPNINFPHYNIIAGIPWGKHFLVQHNFWHNKPLFLSPSFSHVATPPPSSSSLLLSVSLTLTDCALLWLKRPDAAEKAAKKPRKLAALFLSLLFLVESSRNVRRLPISAAAPARVYRDPFRRCGIDLLLIYSPACLGSLSSDSWSLSMPRARPRSDGGM